MQKELRIVEIVCLIGVLIFLYNVQQSVTKTSAQLVLTLQATQRDAENVQQMLNATLFQIGNLSNAAAQTILMEQKYIKQESQELIRTNAKLNQTLDQAQVSIRDSGDALQAGLKPLPAAVEEAQRTLSSTTLEITELQKTTAALTDLTVRLQPAATQLSGTMEHVNNLSRQADEVVAEMRKPKPWYKRYLDDFLMGVKAVAVFY
jgi:hypothetical protein